MADDDADRDLVSRAIVPSVQKPPGRDTVATTIVDAAFGNWRMTQRRGRPVEQARRFMPTGPVDGSLRKTFGPA